MSTKSVSLVRRTHALRDGVRIDVTPVVREAGSRYPVALTRAVWRCCLAVPPGVLGQDETGRLWAICWMLCYALTRAARGAQGNEVVPLTCRGRVVRFALQLRNDNRERMPPRVRLKAVCGPGDDGEPGLTVTRPDED